ncbi:MAG: DUF1273 family protein [Clostridia bacterium]|nr:DUF1273 family protein [Clostridia bacterium]
MNNTPKTDEKMRSCLFTGHRTLPLEGEEFGWLEKALKKEIIEAYRKGYRTFYSGGAAGFDMLCALTVINLRQSELPDLRLVFALPCYNHYKNWDKNDKLLFAHLLERADDIVYVSEEYTQGCMHKRNRYMVDHSSLCIAYCTKSTGGTAYTVNYAQKNGVSTRWLTLI